MLWQFDVMHLSMWILQLPPPPGWTKEFCQRNVSVRIPTLPWTFTSQNIYISVMLEWFWKELLFSESTVGSDRNIRIPRVTSRGRLLQDSLRQVHNYDNNCDILIPMVSMTLCLVFLNKTYCEMAVHTVIQVWPETVHISPHKNDNLHSHTCHTLRGHVWCIWPHI